MLPLTEEIERLEGKTKETYEAGDMDKLRTLKTLQEEQNSKGGPATEHHDTRRSVSRSKP